MHQIHTQNHSECAINKSCDYKQSKIAFIETKRLQYYKAFGIHSALYFSVRNSIRFLVIKDLIFLFCQTCKIPNQSTIATTMQTAQNFEIKLSFIIKSSSFLSFQSYIKIKRSYLLDKAIRSLDILNSHDQQHMLHTQPENL